MTKTKQIWLIYGILLRFSRIVAEIRLIAACLGLYLSPCQGQYSPSDYLRNDIGGKMAKHLVYHLGPCRIL